MIHFDRDAAPRLSISWRGSARRLVTEQWLGLPPDKVFPFFADASNLEAITPEMLRFRIVTPQPIRMQEGALIDYRLRLRGFPMRWRTLIAAWEPPYRFVDVQLKGPYRLWHHEHTFTPLDGGVMCRDIVHYAHFGGRLVHDRLVRPDLARIFEFRRTRLEEILGGASSGYAGSHAENTPTRSC